MDINLMTWALVGCGIGASALVLSFYKKGKYAEIYSIVKSLVSEAETKFGSGTGKIKYEYVVGKLYAIIPGFIKIFISEELLDLWIETAVKELQAYLEEKTEK